MRRLLSFAEFERLPDWSGKQELIEGELIEFPPAILRHMSIVKRVYALLLAALHESRVWMETGYQITPRSWVIPDISVNWPDQKEERGYMQGSPMLAVEVISEGNTAAKMDRKIQLYFQHGSGAVWVVYPETRSMTVYSTQDGRIRAERLTESYTCELTGVQVSIPNLFDK